MTRWRRQNFTRRARMIGLNRWGLVALSGLVYLLATGCGEVKIAPVPKQDVDVAPADVSDKDTGSTDTSTEDSGPPTGDTQAQDTLPPGCDGDTQDAGCPCASNDECASSFCFITSEGKKCADLCETDCPPGYECSPVSAQGGDPIFICVQRTLYYCMPCTDNGDCIVPGFEGEDKCVSYGDEGSFCGVACIDSSTCTAGASCVDGQCKSDAGTCDCAPLHQSLEASTACSQTNGFGSCDGIRQCTADGLSVCDALVPASDNCDGVDNDCDGILDEDCSYQLRGHMMGGGFILANDANFVLSGTTGAPRILGVSEGKDFILRAGHPTP